MHLVAENKFCGTSEDTAEVDLVYTDGQLNSCFYKMLIEYLPKFTLL